MEIVALKKFTYAGKKHFAGDRLSVRRKDGRAFVFIGKAAVAPEAEEIAPVVEEVIETFAEEVVVEKPTRKHTYRRRDMTAETE